MQAAAHLPHLSSSPPHPASKGSESSSSALPGPLYGPVDESSDRFAEEALSCCGHSYDYMRGNVPKRNEDSVVRFDRSRTT